MDTTATHEGTHCIWTPYAGGQHFVVTNDMETHDRLTKERKIVFTWPEMLAILDAKPNETDLTWALKIKKSRSGVRISSIKKRKITHT
jgi:hypothetical protein